MPVDGMRTRRFAALASACFVLLHCAAGLKYPNEILETPFVLCEPERVVIKVQTTSSNPSHIYVEDMAEDAVCSSQNSNQLAIPIGQCGMTAERADNPNGIIQRVCITVQLHPLFVTEADKSYCAQCVYVENQILEDFEQTLAISEHQATELDPQFDFEVTPKCSYTIRKDSRDGPEAHYASVGEQVFHVWSCDSATAGILVQNCYVEDGQGNRILIIDQNGCGVDHYVMATPNYTDDLTTAFQETHVFKFAQKTITRFTCQIRICYKGKDCTELSPPRACPSLEDRLAMLKRLRDAPRYSPPKEFLDNAIEKELNVQGFPRPPKMSFNFTEGHGRIYYHDNSSRRRRETLARQIVEPRLLRSTDGVDRMIVSGELTVLETPDDVKFYEDHLMLSARNASSTCPTTSAFIFPATISCLVLTSLMLLVMVLLVVKNSTHFNSKDWLPG